MASVSERARRSVVRCREDDLAELIVFQRASFGPGDVEHADAHMDWLYRQNPQATPDGLGIWISRRHGRIVGQQERISFGLKVGHEMLRAAIPTRLTVAPEWRLRGIGPALSAAMEGDSRLVCSFLMTDDALRMYRHAGWNELGEIPRFVVPLSRHAMRAHAARSPLASVALAPIMSVEALAARLRASRTDLVEVPCVDHDVDDVWEQSADSYEVLADRRFEQLAWRFDRGPNATLYRRFYLRRGERTVAYLVTRERPGEV